MQYLGANYTVKVVRSALQVSLSPRAKARGGSSAATGYEPNRVSRPRRHGQPPPNRQIQFRPASTAVAIDALPHDFAGSTSTRTGTSSPPSPSLRAISTPSI
jgi:hypothetical protein